MSEKINKVIEVSYQAAGAATGLSDVTMQIYDETHALDGVNFPDVVMTEIGSTGRYYGSFTPDAEGDWTVMIDSSTKPGKVVRHFAVVGHDVDSVGDAVAVTDGKVDTVTTGVATVDGKVDALNDISTSDVNTEVGSALTSYDVAKASDIVSPPMLG